MLRKALIALAFTACAGFDLRAQDIDTIAGGAGDGLPALQAHVYAVVAMQVDANGDLLVLDFANGRLRRIAKGTGIVATGVGSSQRDGTRPGTPIHRAGLGGAFGFAIEAGGGYVFADAVANRIVRVAPGGAVLEAIAGTGEAGFSGDGGPATSARFDRPTRLVATATGDLFVADYGNRRIRKIAAGTGIVTTAVTLSNQSPVAMVGDDAGNLYIGVASESPSAPNAVLKLVIATGALSTYAGGGSSSFTEGVPATSVPLRPRSLAVGPAGDLYVGDDLGTLWKVAAATGALTTFAGRGTGGGAGNGGPAISARFIALNALAFDRDGNLFVADSLSIRRIDAATGIVDAYAGDDRYLGDGQPANNARLVADGMVVDPAGNLYVSGFTYGPGPMVRRIDAATSVITTIPGLAGGGTYCIARFPNGDLAVCGTSTVYRVDLGAGTTTIYAGGNSSGARGDGGPATAARVKRVSDIAIDASGVLYIHDEDDARVRRVDPSSGVITTFAGGGTVQGDGVAADTVAFPFSSAALAIDPSGRLLIAQSGAIRRVDPATGLISSILKYGGIGSPLEGPAPDVFLAGITAVAADAAGNIYFGDGARIRRISSSTGFVSTIAGYGARGYGGDGGPATAAEVLPSRLALDGRGGLLMADGEDRPMRSAVRRIELGGLALAPGRGTFWERLPGTTSLPFAFTVSNLGATPATVTGSSASPGFQVFHDCATIPAFGHCFAYVQFAPTSLGKVSGQVAIIAGGRSHATFLEGTGEASLVTPFYESILRRVPDTNGKNFWEGERTRLAADGADPNETWFAMAAYFFSSAEYRAFNRDAAGFVTDLYRTFFNRGPDAAGLSFWVGEIEAGVPREVVLAEFMLSTEFSQFVNRTFGAGPTNPVGVLVMDMYRGILGRLPDHAGYLSWTSILRSEACKGLDPLRTSVQYMVTQFVYGAEYSARGRDNAQFVGDLYNAFLRRGGERLGVRFWIDALDTGALTRQQVLDSFYQSGEFQARLAIAATQPCPP